MNTRSLRVFLCHASADKPTVRKLSRRLAAEGWIDPWLDEEKLSFGQHWTTVIEEALDEADVVIIFLSRNSVQKEGFVQRELNYAWELSLEKPRNVIFLIPFRLDDCEVPRYLSSRQWGDYFGDKEESTYQVLLRSLKQRHEQRLHLEAEEQKQRVAAEKAARQKAARETAEKAAREKAERDVAEKTKRKNPEPPVGQNAILFRTPAQKKKQEEKSSRKFDSRKIGIAGIILFVLLCGIFGIIYVFNNWPVAISPIPISHPPTIAMALTQTAFAQPTPTFTPQPSATNTLAPVTFAPFGMGAPAVQPTSSCDVSVYVSDVTVPDGTTMAPGQVFTKTWLVKNTGTCTWTATYKVGFGFGSSMSGVPTEIGKNVAPGEQVQVSVVLTAPNTSGEVNGVWRLMNDEGKFFGTSVTVIIKVVGAPTRTNIPTKTPTATP